MDSRRQEEHEGLKRKEKTWRNRARLGLGKSNEEWNEKHIYISSSHGTWRSKGGGVSHKRNLANAKWTTRYASLGHFRVCQHTCTLIPH